MKLTDKFLEPLLHMDSIDLMFIWLIISREVITLKNTSIVEPCHLAVFVDEDALMWRESCRPRETERGGNYRR